jgi:hypothetical protein
MPMPAPWTHLHEGERSGEVMKLTDYKVSAGLAQARMIE